MSGSDNCFLACIQVSEEIGKMVLYSQFVKNFPQLVMIHTVKGFSHDTIILLAVFSIISVHNSVRVGKDFSGDFFRTAMMLLSRKPWGGDGWGNIILN